jgi:chromosome segregation ATPase
MIRHMLSFALLGLMVAACGGAPVPNQELATAHAAVRAAEVGGANEDPQAELRLKNARDKIAEAEALMKEGDNELAALRLQEAEADGELASALSRQAKAKAEVAAALKRIKQLREASGS